MRFYFARKELTPGQKLTKGIIQSVALGYAAGNVYGAVIAAAVSTVTKVINFGIESNKIDLQRTVDDIGRAQANIRAGAGGGRMGKNY